jgi:hypothetical protein
MASKPGAKSTGNKGSGDAASRAEGSAGSRSAELKAGKDAQNRGSKSPQDRPSSTKEGGKDDVKKTYAATAASPVFGSSHRAPLEAQLERQRKAGSFVIPRISTEAEKAPEFSPLGTRSSKKKPSTNKEAAKQSKPAKTTKGKQVTTVTTTTTTATVPAAEKVPAPERSVATTTATATVPVAEKALVLEQPAVTSTSVPAGADGAPLLKPAKKAWVRGPALSLEARKARETEDDNTLQLIQDLRDRDEEVSDELLAKETRIQQFRQSLVAKARNAEKAAAKAASRAADSAGKTPRGDGSKKKRKHDKGGTSVTRGEPGDDDQAEEELEADAAAKRAKVGSKRKPEGKRESYPHLLYLNRTQETREFLPQADFTFILHSWEEEVIQSVEGDDPIRLRVAWSGWKDGSGYVACKDAYTSQWLKAFVGNLTGRDGTLDAYRAWDKSEQVGMRVATMVVRKGMLQGRQGQQVFELVRKLANPPLAGSGRWKETTTLKTSGGTRYTFLIDDLMAMDLNRRHWEVNLPSCTSRIRYHDKWEELLRRNPQSSEPHQPAAEESEAELEEEMEVDNGVKPTEEETAESESGLESEPASGAKSGARSSSAV